MKKTDVAQYAHNQVAQAFGLQKIAEGSILGNYLYGKNLAQHLRREQALGYALGHGRAGAMLGATVGVPVGALIGGIRGARSADPEESRLRAALRGAGKGALIGGAAGGALGGVGGGVTGGLAGPTRGTRIYDWLREHVKQNISDSDFSQARARVQRYLNLREDIRRTPSLEILKSHVYPRSDYF